MQQPSYENAGGVNNQTGNSGYTQLSKIVKNTYGTQNTLMGQWETTTRFWGIQVLATDMP